MTFKTEPHTATIERAAVDQILSDAALAARHHDVDQYFEVESTVFTLDSATADTMQQLVWNLFENLHENIGSDLHRIGLEFVDVGATIAGGVRVTCSFRVKTKP